jgi:hypothetical protein
LTAKNQNPNDLSAFERAIESNKVNAGRAKMPAPKTFQIKPEHFAATWGNRPIDGILLGLRVPSESDVQGARTEAEKRAREIDSDSDQKIGDEERVNIFNESLMCSAVASAICDPADVTAPHPFFDMPDDMVPVALTPRTIKYIFDSVEILHIEQSPIFSEIDETDEAKLVDVLCRDEPYASATGNDAAKARRLLKCALDLLE